jgi:septum formation inhibitor-activating ATPase MinD
VVDFDVGLRNLDLVMGAERRVVGPHQRRAGRRQAGPGADPGQARRNAVPFAGVADRDKDALTEEGVGRVIAELRTMFDWVICDSPPASSAAPPRHAVCRCRGLDCRQFGSVSVRDSIASSDCSIPRL